MKSTKIKQLKRIICKYSLTLDNKMDIHIGGEIAVVVVISCNALRIFSFLNAVQWSTQKALESPRMINWWKSPDLFKLGWKCIKCFWKFGFQVIAAILKIKIRHNYINWNNMFIATWKFKNRVRKLVISVRSNSTIGSLPFIQCR